MLLDNKGSESIFPVLIGFFHGLQWREDARGVVRRGNVRSPMNWKIMNGSRSLTASWLLTIGGMFVLMSNRSDEDNGGIPLIYTSVLKKMARLFPRTVRLVSTGVYHISYN